MSGCCVCVPRLRVWRRPELLVLSACGIGERREYRDTEIQKYSDKPAFLVPLRILRLHRREPGELAGTQVLSPYRAFSGCKRAYI